MKKLICITLLLALAACSNKPDTLKSPCVGIEKSPCVRMPINEGVA